MKNNHSFTEISLHLVLVTKYRRPFPFVRSIIEDAVSSSGAILEEIGIADNHVHIMMEVSVTKNICKIIEIIKTVSSKKFLKLYGNSWPFWQTGYYACSVGRSSKSKLKSYLENQ